MHKNWSGLLVKKAKVSVIIPVHRESPEVLEACFNSVLHQSYQPAAVYVILDPHCSTPAAETVTQFAQDTSIKAIRDPNQGSASHRNLGVSLALEHSDYLAFTDADCIVSRDWLKELLECMNVQPPEIGCVGGTNIAKESIFIG